MKKIQKLMLSSALMFSVMSSHSAYSAERVTYKSAKSSSSYYQMAVQIAEISKSVDLQVTVEESQGSVQNVKEAKIRLGNYVFTTPPGLIDNAIKGEDPFTMDESYQNIRALFPIPALTMHYVMDADLNVRTFADLTDESIIIGKGSFSSREAKRTFELMGLNDLDLIEVELDSVVSSLQNGKVDGFVTASSWPTPNVVETVASKEITLISLSEEEVEKTGSTRAVIPANTYKGVDYDVVTTSLPVGAYTTTQMSDETAYKLTKAFWHNKDSMASSSPWWDGVTLDSVATLAGEIHAGAKKYYQEVGVDL